MAETPSEHGVRRYWEEFWSKGDRSAVDEFYADTFRLNGEDTSRDEWRDGAERWRSKFSDIRVEVDKLFTSGEVVVSRIIFRGTHTGDLAWLPATGRSFEVGGIDIFEFEDGRVVDHWHEVDHLDLFEQLGAEVRPASV